MVFLIIIIINYNVNHNVESNTHVTVNCFPNSDSNVGLLHNDIHLFCGYYIWVKFHSKATGWIITILLSYTAHYVCYKTVGIILSCNRSPYVSTVLQFWHMFVYKMIYKLPTKRLTALPSYSTRIATKLIASCYTVLEIPNIWVLTHTLHKAVLQGLNNILQG